MKTESTEQEYQHHLSHHHHMRVQWEEFFQSDDETKIKEATLIEKGSIISRVGMMILSCGTGAWRVRDAMDTLARTLDLTCSTDIGLISIVCTYFDVDNQSYSQSLALPTTGVNMAKLNELEKFVRQFEAAGGDFEIKTVRRRLGEIEHMKGRYPLWGSSLAAALACGGFIFLLGGGFLKSSAPLSGRDWASLPGQLSQKTDHGCRYDCRGGGSGLLVLLPGFHAGPLAL